MSLTDRQREIIIGGIKSKVRSGCPMCGQGNWTVGDDVVICTTSSLKGGIMAGGPVIPMAQVICNNCGFVCHHAVGALGINLNDS